MKELVEIRGKKIYVEVHGSDDAPALLYLHGGPGQGSYDFSILQAKSLAQHVRLVIIDQRGVLRSEEIREEEEFKLDDIIHDCEELRKYLQLASWSVLGHSFGAYLALCYALEYPTVIDKLIFDCPAFDLYDSSCSLLLGAAEQFEELQLMEQAEACRQLATSEVPVEGFWWRFFEPINELGEYRNHLYVWHEEKDFYEKLVTDSPFPRQWWEKSNTFSQKLMQEGRMFEPLTKRLAELTCPALLVRGRYDWVSSTKQVHYFQELVSLGESYEFTQSAHFPRFEEKEQYAEIISSFLLKNQSLKINL